MIQLLREYKPALIFLARFIGIYLVGNILYGLWIESYDKADPLTREATRQTSGVLNVFGFHTTIQDKADAATVSLMQGTRVVVNVYEGCNGINVLIVFVAFLVAYRGRWKANWWYLPLGMLVIHIANLSRIALLFVTALRYQDMFYYFHKYFFTAILYAVVLVLWAGWVRLHRHAVTA